MQFSQNCIFPLPKWKNVMLKNSFLLIKNLPFSLTKRNFVIEKKKNLLITVVFYFDDSLQTYLKML